MSTRSRKSKSTTQQSTTSTSRTSTSTSAAETPGPSTPAAASTSFSSPRTGTPGRMRPPSPTVIGRAQEKTDLANLNDRLATYIDKVRSLESENSRLTKIVRTHEEEVTSKTHSIKNAYEKELAATRSELDRNAKERAAFELERDKFATENRNLVERNAALERELKDTQRQKLQAEGQVNDLQARLNDAVNQRKHWENEFNKVRRELDELKKQHAQLLKQHEEETVKRVDLTNRLQTLKEDLAFRQQVHDQEMSQMKTRTRVEIEEVDGRIQQEYDSRLREALQQMREENDEAINAAREETEAAFQSKLERLMGAAGQNEKAAERARNELKTMRIRMEELSRQVTQLSSENAGHVSRIAQLEARLAKEDQEHQDAVSALNAEITRLREALEDQMIEYRDLLDIKIQLDNEIQSYRRMLESEETRLNISTAEEATPSRSYRRTPVRGIKKRKRGQEDMGQSYFQSGSEVDYTQKSSAKGSVEVKEMDTDGKFIKLYNNSDKDQALGGWQLKHTVGEQETTYKFHRSTNIKANTYVTVWSADSGETHNPPSDMVMKGQTWFTGDSMRTELFNPQGEEQATLDLEKSELHTTYRGTMGGSSSGSEVESFQEGDPQEKCAIM